jgi:hypothetical protein
VLDLGDVAGRAGAAGREGGEQRHGGEDEQAGHGRIFPRGGEGRKRNTAAADLASRPAPAHVCARVPGAERSCTVAITWEQIDKRIHRLNALTMGLMREDFIWTKDNLHDHPLLFVETRAYLKAIRDALAGVETARIVLAKARQRHAEGRGK